MNNASAPWKISIKSLYLWLVVGYLLIWVTGLVGYRALVAHPSEMARAAAEQQRAVDSFRAVIDIKKEQLQTTAIDYSYWDDTWDFINGRLPGYLQANFQPSTFATLKMNYAFIVDRQNSIVAAFHYDIDSDTLTPLQTFPSGINNDVLQNLFTDGPAKAILTINGRATFVGANPVTRSDGSGPVAGWLLYGQILSSESIATFERVTRLQIREIAVGDYADLDSPITAPANVLERCVVENNQPVVCLEIKDPETTIPDVINNNLWKEFILLGLIPAGLFAFILRLIHKPLQQAQQHLLMNARTGQPSHIPVSEHFQIKELARLARSHNHLVDTIMLQNSQLKELSHTDALTAIPNRRSFDMALGQCWSRLRRNQLSMALCLIDVDQFKRYNDFYGHPDGDKVLRQVASVLSLFAKRTDESVARYGGEEFAILMYARNREELEQNLAGIHEQIAALAIPHAQSTVNEWLSVSIGAAWIFNSGEWIGQLSMASWLKSADQALYEAKANGRSQNCVVELRKEGLPDLAIEGDESPAQYPTTDAT